MIKLLLLLAISILSLNVSALSLDDDKLKESYIKYDSLYQKSDKSDTTIFLHALTKFDGKESVSIIKTIPDDSELTQEKKRYIADYYFSLGSYLTAAKLYREFLEKQIDKDVIISLLTTDMVAAKFDDYKRDNKKYGDILPEYLKSYFELLYLNKMGKNKEALKLVNSFEINELFADDFTYKIKAHSLKLEILVATGNKTDAARLAKYLVDNYENVPEVRRWLDLYPNLGKMVKDKSTQLSGSSSSKSSQKVKNSKNKVFYGYQFGSFSTKANADMLKNVLENKYKSKGVSIYIRKQNRSGKTVYAVTTHAFSSEENARKYYEKEYKKIVQDKMFFVKIYK